MGTLTSAFDYSLPESLIAQSPSRERAHSRLLVIDKGSGRIVHGKKFRDLPCFLRGGDVLVINDTKVIRARLAGKKASTGARVEFLLLRKLSGEKWETLIRPSRRVREGTEVLFGANASAEILENLGGGKWKAEFRCHGGFEALLDEIGSPPLPPYIRPAQGEDFAERYQTVYARNPGASAAPTAGMHFTGEMLEQIRLMGVAVAPVTVHTGAGTFMPVKEEFAENHSMSSEYYRLSPETARLINGRSGGSRVFAVGTTSVRALETAAAPGGTVAPGEGFTDIFILPGHRFQCVDALITNLHPPRSTTLMLTAAFAGTGLLLRAYAEAVSLGYRFLSLGDASLITPRLFED